MINKSFQSVSFLSILFLIANISTIKPKITINLTYDGKTIAELSKEVAETSLTIKNIFDNAEVKEINNLEINFPDSILEFMPLEEFKQHFLPLMEYLANNISLESRPRKLIYNLIDMLTQYDRDFIAAITFVAGFLEVPEIFEACLRCLTEELLMLSAKDLLEYIMIYSIGDCMNDTHFYRALRFLDHYLVTRLIKLYPKMFRICTLKQELVGHNNQIAQIQFSEDGEKLFTASKNVSTKNFTVKEWNVTTGELLNSYVQMIPKKEFLTSPDKTKKIIINGFSAKIVDIEDKIVLDLKDFMISSIGFNAESTKILVGLLDGSTLIYNLKTQQKEHKFKKHTNLVSAVAWNNNRMFATGSKDHSVKLWKFVINGDNDNNIHFIQALFILLLNKLQMNEDHLSLYDTDEWTQVLREIFDTFNQESQEYLIETYNIEF